jgi:2-aminomuconate deaminase
MTAGTSRKGDQMITINSHQAPEPVGAYPHARLVGGFLFLSGVGPRKPGTKLIPGVNLDSNGQVVGYDLEIQTESVIENIRSILSAAGARFEQIVDVQVFLTDMKKDFATFNKVYEKHFKQIQATRTTVQVGALPTPIQVEFKVIAYLGDQ